MPLLTPPLLECKPPEKPKVVCRPSRRYGVPRGVAGRNGQVVKGIVIHCLNTTLDDYSMQVCGDPGRLSRSNGPKASLHYGINLNGGVQQYVDDLDIAWGLDFTVPRGTTTPVYRCPNDCPVPPVPCDVEAPTPVTDPNYLPDWALTAANPGVPFDYYLLHIGVEASGTRVAPIVQSFNDCGDCADGLTGSQFSTPEVNSLVQLIAYLAERYALPIDKDHINFWANIDPCEREECGCAPCIVNLICEVQAYCQAPIMAADVTFIEGGPLVFVNGQSRYGDKITQRSHQFLISHLRMNMGVLEAYNDATGTWLPIPTI